MPAKRVLLGVQIVLLTTVLRRTTADCAIRDIGLPEVINVAEDCGLDDVKNGQACTFDAQRCFFSDTIVRSFTCNEDAWVWTSPPVYCEPFSWLCEWSIITNTLLCDYARASKSPLHADKVGILDRRLEAISFLNFPRQFKFNRDSFLGLESRLRILTIRSGNKLDAIPGSFTGLSQLVHLDLRNNSLTNINVYTLPPLGRLEYLDLRGNPELAAEAGTDPYAMHAAMESCWPKTAPQSRTLLMDDAACDIEIKDGVDPALECAVVVCKKPSATLIPCPSLCGSTAGDGMNTTLISPAQLCNGVSECQASTDEQAAICKGRTVSTTILDPTSSPLCATLEGQFGSRFLYPSGLAVMTLDNTVSFLFKGRSIILWQRLSSTTAEFDAKRDPGYNTEVRDIDGQLLLALDSAVLNMSFALLLDDLAPQEVTCVVHFQFEDSTTTSTSTSTTTTTALAFPEETQASEEAQKMTSGLQPAAAAAIGSGAAALLMVGVALVYLQATKRRKVAANTTLAPPVPRHVIEQVRFLLW